MGKVRAACLALCLTMSAAPAIAQITVDVGGHGGAACLNGRPNCTGGFLGPFAGVQWRDRVAVRVRYFSVDIGDWTNTFTGITIRRTDRSGRLVVGEILYEFVPEQKVRPFLGLSVGQRVFRLLTTCEPITCEEASAWPGGPGVAGGATRYAKRTVGVVAGFTFRPVKQVAIQWLVGFHDPLSEHNETVETALLVGWSIWRSR